MFIDSMGSVDCSFHLVSPLKRLCQQLWPPRVMIYSTEKLEDDFQDRSHPPIFAPPPSGIYIYIHIYTYTLMSTYVFYVHTQN